VATNPPMSRGAATLSGVDNGREQACTHLEYESADMTNSKPCAKRIEPPPGAREEAYHWVRRKHGETEPMEWTGFAWLVFGVKEPISPEEAYRRGWQWHKTCLP